MANGGEACETRRQYFQSITCGQTLKKQRLTPILQAATTTPDNTSSQKGYELHTRAFGLRALGKTKNEPALSTMVSQTASGRAMRVQMNFGAFSSFYICPSDWSPITFLLSLKQALCIHRSCYILLYCHPPRISGIIKSPGIHGSSQEGFCPHDFF